MRFFNIQDVWQKLIWPWRPESDREAGSGIVANFLLHWFPNRISLRSLAFPASFYLGTITFIVFLVLKRRKARPVEEPEPETDGTGRVDIPTGEDEVGREE